MLEGLIATGAVRVGGKQDDLFVRYVEFDESLTDGKGVLDRRLEVEQGGFSARGRADEIGDHDIDVMFLEAFEAGEGMGVDERAVHEQAGESLFEGGASDLGMITFFSADERC